MKISKNFKMLFDYEFLDDQKIQSEIEEKIAKLEESTKRKDIENLPNVFRTLLEDLLLYGFNIEGSLNEKIRELKDGVHINTNVLGALEQIKRSGNSGSHGMSKKSDRVFKMDFTIEDAQICLRSLWLIIKFIISEKMSGTYEINFDFDMNEYRNWTDILGEKKSELDNPNDDIKNLLLSITQLLTIDGYSFNIPTYQRDYTWNVENIEKLLEDIDDRQKDGKTHYMGSLAIAQDDANKVLRIIDGQQRITSTLIILRAFYDEAMSRKIEVQKELSDLIKKKINTIYINQKVLVSQIAVEKVLQNNIATSDATTKNSAAINNYKKVREWLSLKPNEEIMSSYEIFATRFQVATISFQTTIDNEMDIFENLNTGGTKLTEWELIKNYIFSRMDPMLFTQKEHDANTFIIQKLQAPIVGDTKKITSTLKSFFTQYIRHVYASQHKVVWKERTVYESFKSIWPKKSGKFVDYNLFIEELNNVVKKLNLYIEFTTGYKISSSPLYPYRHILNFIMKDDIVPLLFELMEKYGEFKESKLVKINFSKVYPMLKALELYGVRLLVADSFGNSQAKDYDKFLVENIDEITPSKFFVFTKTQMQPSLPSNDEFVNALKTRGNLNQTAITNILINIERYLHGVNPRAISYISIKETHEHILAKQMSFTDYGKNISYEEYIDQTNRWRDSIGNALILSQSQNSSIGNASFMDKVETYKEANLNIINGVTNGDKKLMNLTTKKIFTFEDIALRSEQLANIALDVFDPLKILNGEIIKKS